MTTWSDIPDEMRRLRLDEDTQDRLLAGRVDPDDAPPGFSEVAHVLAAAASEERAGLVHEAEHVALAIGLVKGASAASTPSPGRSRTMRSWSRRVKIGGLVLVGALAGSTGLAAAGVLPDAAQDAFSDVLERVGITVPASEDHPASTGEEISEIATTTESTGVEKGAEISSVASGGMSQAGQHGSAVEGAGVEGSGAAETASAGGRSTAEDASQGRSGAGSGNASVAPSAPASPPT